MAKKVLTDYQKIEKEFQEDFNDNELQERFENFESAVKDFKGLYNILVPQINKQTEEVRTLNGMILASAKMGFINKDAIKQLKETEASLAEQTKAADEYKERFTKEEDLIKKYKENAHSKLFHYWKMFKALDKTTAPWLDWKRNYDKRIF